MRNGFINKMIGFLLGGVVGATLGYLTAPRSGVDTRSMLNDKGKAALDTMVGHYQEKRDQAEEMINNMNQEMTDRTEKLKKVGQKVMHQERKIIEEGIQETKQAVSA